MLYQFNIETGEIVDDYKDINSIGSQPRKRQIKRVLDGKSLQAYGFGWTENKEDIPDIIKAYVVHKNHIRARMIRDGHK